MDDPGDLEDHPLELQWTTRTPKYKIGQPIFFLKHANLGGAAGVTSLAAQQRERTVVSHHTMPGNLLLHGVEGVSGVDQGKHPASSLSARAIFNDPPADWCLPVAHYRGRKRPRRY